MSRIPGRALWGWRYVVAVLSLVGWLLVELLVSGNLLFQLFAVAFLSVTVLAVVAAGFCWREGKRIIYAEREEESLRRHAEDIQRRFDVAIAQERLLESDGVTPRQQVH